jgi:hypothetical protein
MDWEYSEPLNGALIAASKNTTRDLTGLGTLGPYNKTSSLYSNYYSDYDPLISRYKARASYFNRPTDPILFDDLDDLTLEVEANSMLSSRYRPSNQTSNPSRYIPSYYDLNKASFNANPLLENDDNDLILNNKTNQNTINNSNIPRNPNPNNNNNNNSNNNNNNNGIKKSQPKISNKLAQQLQPRTNQLNSNIQASLSSPNVYQQKFQPIPFNNNANQNIVNNQPSSSIPVNTSNPNLQQIQVVYHFRNRLGVRKMLRIKYSNS